MYRLKLCAIVFTMNWGMDNWVHYCFYSSTSPQTKLKPMKKHQLRATALMSHELMAITCNSLVRYNQIRIFKLFLIGQIRCHSGFNRWLPPSPRTRHVKKLQIFFLKICNYLPTVFQRFILKNCIALLCSFSQIRSHIVTNITYKVYRYDTELLIIPHRWRDRCLGMAILLHTNMKGGKLHWLQRDITKPWTKMILLGLFFDHSFY